MNKRIKELAREADSGFEGGPDADGTMSDSLVGINAIERFAALVAAEKDKEIAALREENERLREENERYRWLQANALAIDLVGDPDNFVQVWVGTDPARVFRGRTLDDAVSEAMKEAALRKEEPK
jgi:hypothetical protein